MSVPFDIIAAVSENGIIGNQGGLPWPRIAKDLSFFRKKTVGHPVIMGRKTWESLGRKQLNDRPTYVVSSEPGPAISDGDVTWVTSLDAALSEIGSRDDISHRAWVVGGAMLYAEALSHPKARRLFLTKVHTTALGDTYMPKVNRGRWVLLESAADYDNTTQIHLTFERYGAQILME